MKEDCAVFFFETATRGLHVFSVKGKVSEVADCATNSEPKASPTRPQIGCRTSGCKKHKGRRWKDPSSAQCPAPQNSNWDCTGVRQGLNLGTLEDWWTLQFQEFDLHHLISSIKFNRLSSSIQIYIWTCWVLFPKGLEHVLSISQSVWILCQVVSLAFRSGCHGACAPKGLAVVMMIVIALTIIIIIIIIIIMMPIIAIL